MKIINAFCVAAMLFFGGSVWADNCTIDKKIELAKAGYSKTQIEEMCNKPPECCCTYTTVDPFKMFKEDEQHYEWMKADECAGIRPNVPTLNGLPAGPGISTTGQCTSSSYCGRSENSEFLPTSIPNNFPIRILSRSSNSIQSV